MKQLAVLCLILFFSTLLLAGYSFRLTNALKVKPTEKIIYLEKKIDRYYVLYTKTQYFLDNIGWKSKYLSEIVTNVIEYSDKRGLDEDLVMSIIYIESGFNPLDKNTYGAVGLMQIVPRHLDDLLKKYDLTKYDCFDISNNIMLGTEQLKYFIEEKNSVALGCYRYNGAKIRKLSKNKVSLPKEGFEYLCKVLDMYYMFKQYEVL